jgi:MFS family permease
MSDKEHEITPNTQPRAESTDDPVSPARLSSAGQSADQRVDADAIINPEHARRNFFLIVMNGFLTVGAIALFDPSTVIPALITHLGGSAMLVGMIAALNNIGWVLPQVFVANWVEPKPKKLFVYRWGAIPRIGSLMVLVALMWHYRNSVPPWFVYCVLGLLFLHWLSTGFQSVGWYDVLGKTVYSARRPMLFAYRRTGMGIFALVSGLVVMWTLGEKSGLAFPTNYAFLLVLMIIFMTIGIFSYCIVKEPADSDIPHERKPLIQFLKRGPRFLREDRNYRLLILGQLSFILSIMVAPFLVPYLMKEAAMDASVIGILMALAVSGELVANLIWGRIGSRKGNRAVLVAASRLIVALPLSAIVAILLPKVVLFGVDVRIALVAVGLIVSRAAGSGIGIGQINYLLDIAPRAIRPSYISFMNTFCMVFWLIPVAAGSIIDRTGYLAVFGAAMAFSLVCSTIYMRLESFTPPVGSNR